MFGGDDSLFDWNYENDDTLAPVDNDSVFGGESDISEERAVLPPSRPLKRPMAMPGEDDNDDNNSEALKKRQKSVASALFEDDRMIVIDSDDEAPSIASSGYPGPSTAHQPSPELQPQKKSKLQERESANLRGWRRRIKELWGSRRKISPEVSKSSSRLPS
jgi:hypothetical protein